MPWRQFFPTPMPSPAPIDIAEVLMHLEAAVRDTTDQQPKLRKAGVVDAGALGMFLYFEGFFHILAEWPDTLPYSNGGLSG